MKATARSITIALTIFSWIAISNHCALSALMIEADRASDVCPFHPEPAKQKENSANVQCCKILRATVSAPTKSWTRDDLKVSDVDLTLDKSVILAEAHNAAPLLLDTGPPGKTFFVALIGSVQAHSPPSLI